MPLKKGKIGLHFSEHPQCVDTGKRERSQNN